jgi:hypothetical protein
MAVGGLDGSGRTASGWFLGVEGNYDVGLADGQTVNLNDGDIDNGYWIMFVDINGDGDYGTYDYSNCFFDFDEGEMISDVRVANSQGFQTGVTVSAGDVSGWYTLPAPSTGSLTTLGIGALTLKWEGIKCVSSIDISAQGTDIDKCSIYLLTKTNLAQTAWTTNVSYSITGAVTRVSTTNAEPNLFFNVTEMTTP